MCCGETDPVWSVCFNNDGNYVTLDTIQLYSDKYHYLKGNCCNIVNWTFTNKSTITISKTKVCQEPPIGSVSYDDQDLKIKIKKL